MREMDEECGVRLRIATEKEKILYSTWVERYQKHEEEEEKVLLELAADDISSSLSNLKIATPEEEREGGKAIKMQTHTKGSAGFPTAPTLTSHTVISYYC